MTKTRSTKTKAATKPKKKAAPKKRVRKELQKKPNGDTAVYVRIKDPLYAIFEKGWWNHIEKHGLNASSYGVGSYIRDLAKKQVSRELAMSKP
jgi:hypothetical protein